MDNTNIENKKDSIIALTMSTIAFTVCFASWLINGVLVTYLVDAQIFSFDKSQFGWLIGIPILTGSIMRLPVGILTDKYGGRIVFTFLMLLSAIPMYFLSMANNYTDFLIASLGFGFTGASFAVGIAYVSLWFKKEKQGTALGIFGVGNVGAAITSILGPTILTKLTDNMTNPEGWRTFPKIYSLVLIIMAIIFFFTTKTKLIESAKGQSFSQRLAPLKNPRVWRFGIYYFLVFGGFVSLSQWLIPYYINVYSVSVAFAGVLASAFSLPSGLIRALGGWLSDKFGARKVMYYILAVCIIGFTMLSIPKMEIRSPGEGLLALSSGIVTKVSSDSIFVDKIAYKLKPNIAEKNLELDNNFIIFPIIETWQEPIVKIGDKIKKKQLLATGITNIYFQANIIIFTILVFISGIAMGIGMAAVYKFIPQYFPDSVGVTGGIVGVIGGLGGFVCPILFGYLLRLTGLWISCWIFLAILSVLCLSWLHFVVTRMLNQKSPELINRIDGL